METPLTCESHEHYQTLKAKIDAYETARNARYPKQYSFTQEELQALNLPIPNNAERSAVETWEFQHQTHDRYGAYVQLEDKTVTTWTGQILGTITGIGREWQDNFGGRRVPIDVVGINKVVYHGTYYKSSGDYCRLKARTHKGSIVVKP